MSTLLPPRCTSERALSLSSGSHPWRVPPTEKTDAVGKRQKHVQKVFQFVSEQTT